MTNSPNGEKKLGRPSIYSQELADLICHRTATSSFGLRKLCSLYDDLPHSDTVWDWRIKNKAFSDQYAVAKLKQAEYMAEEIIDIADDANNDWMETLPDELKSAGWKQNGEHVNRSRLRIDTRKWLAAKLLPKTYGNKESDEDKTKDSLIEKLVDKITDK